VEVSLKVRVVLALVVLLVVSAGLVNLGWKAYRWCQALNPAWRHPVAFGLLYSAGLILVLAAVGAGQLSGAAWTRWPALVGYVGLGVIVYSLLAVLLVDLLRLVGRLVKVIPAPTPRPLAITCGLVVVALVVGLCGAGLADRAWRLDTVRYQVHLAGPTAEPVRLALLSDLHLGLANRAGHLSRVVDAVERAEPDVIVLAGDIFDSNFTALGDPAPIRAQFERLQAPLGVYAILGNHDGGPTWSRMVELLDSAGVKLLSDQAVEVGGRFTLVGRRDSSPIGGTPTPRQPVPALTDTETKRPIIVLDHQPSHLREYLGQADLMLSGHTHRGQIWPVNWLVDAIYEVPYGHWRDPAGSLQAIVTSGAGTWGPPMRLGSHCEIAVIDLSFG
jgi:predicted MPP superfamily phosphohydrolase